MSVDRGWCLRLGEVCVCVCVLRDAPCSLSESASFSDCLSLLQGSHPGSVTMTIIGLLYSLLSSSALPLSPSTKFLEISSLNLTAATVCLWNVHNALITDVQAVKLLIFFFQRIDHVTGEWWKHANTTNRSEAQEEDHRYMYGHFFFFHPGRVKKMSS